MFSCSYLLLSTLCICIQFLPPTNRSLYLCTVLASSYSISANSSCFLLTTLCICIQFLSPITPYLQTIPVPLLISANSSCLLLATLCICVQFLLLLATFHNWMLCKKSHFTEQQFATESNASVALTLNIHCMSSPTHEVWVHVTARLWWTDFK